MNFHRKQRTHHTPSICLLIACLAGSTFAQDESSQEPEDVQVESNSDRVHLSLGLDYTSQYFFRGIVQETDGLIIQPWAEVGFDLIENDDFSLSAYMGVWGSVHDEETGATDPDEFISKWYEVDLYAGLSLSKGRLSTDLVYTNYSSPNGAFGNIDEISISVSWDDSGWIDWVTLSPYATVAFEIGDNQADGGTDLGTFFGIGIEPAHTYESTAFGDITVSLPIEAGFSLSDYYEGSTGDESFGYLTAGLAASIPLPAPDGFGDWSLNTGIDYLILGDSNEALNNGSDDEWVFHTGLSFAF